MRTIHPQGMTKRLASIERGACGTGFVANISGEKSHDIVRKAIQSVVNLTHRGAVSADAKTGDGAGVLTQIPAKLFRKAIEKMGRRLERDEDLAVGVIFFPRQQLYSGREKCRVIIEEAINRHKLKVIGWRPVPIDESALGEKAQSTQPEIEHILIERGKKVSLDQYEKTLYLIRREIEKRVRAENIDHFYIPSFSSRTIVYKGLLVAPQLKKFYLDLSDPDYETALAVFHQRYSTNTFPNWYLAQPFRMIAHNGEINTLQGNINWMRSREAELRSPLWKNRIQSLIPVIQPGGSDSACLDNVLELLMMSGRDLLHTFMMMVPEAWENSSLIDPQVRAFYEFHAGFSEPWDGPAALAFTDGKLVGATLDRNGLRPARYTITKNGLMIMGSEVGMIEIDDAEVVEKGRLGPGMMIAVDTERGEILRNDDIKKECASRQPYSEWLERQTVLLEHLASTQISGGAPVKSLDLTRQQAAFGYTQEEMDLVIKPMVTTAKEAVGSMGDDTPLAVLSLKPRLLYNYFKQLFAQVTNPPIDHLRETLVMTLHTYLGGQKNLLEESEGHARLIRASSHLLTEHELEVLKRLQESDFRSVTLKALFPINKGSEGLEEALDQLCTRASLLVSEGYHLLVISDRGVDQDHAPLPMLLAVGALHHHLIREGKRMKVSLIVETGEARDVHQIATLVGYGASAVCPYLAYETVRHLVASGEVPEVKSVEEAVKNYRAALQDGFLKIMSKMGISSISSYRGAQIFEVIGLSRTLVDKCFAGTASRIGGIGINELAKDQQIFHTQAYPRDFEKQVELTVGGYFRYRSEGEYHAFNPEVIKTLHAYIKSAKWDEYVKFAETVNHRQPTALRDLLRIKKGKPVPIGEVEPVEEIYKRFAVSGMSVGALGPEAHETLAIAMNRIGAKSSSGEGGENRSRYTLRPNGDDPKSHVKQVASGRFGVTTEYLMSAREFEIKMAQGSKPGEGGQLPGHKVTAEIAEIRHAVPGITLISPPPHHDIYSIEDLAQLIYDLKQVNPRAKVCVKLVAESGVGTVAAGVAKGYADIILISGHDGGTGASPLSSIKYVGSAWELGLSEAQQILVLNDLRGRVKLRADGGMKTGRDIIVAALLGAEEYGFGTATVVATGCVMARRCHLNTCPVGVATQDPKLRAKYAGDPAHVANYLKGVAEDIRHILAQMGYRRLDDIIGRPELLEINLPQDNEKIRSLDLTDILMEVDPHGSRPKYHQVERNDRPNDEPLDNVIIRDAMDALEGKGRVRLTYKIRNTNRAVGARLAGEVARRFGAQGLPEDSIVCEFHGSAGQSFGAFSTSGMKLILTGEANDYVGKGLSGGVIVVRPSKSAHFTASENVIMGNTVMYGATAGSLYASGKAGERFCVRNSGGQAVIEGTGDHCCEYMTGGLVVVLGATGRNFGAGMTGGKAFVLDEENLFEKRINPQLIRIERLSTQEDKGLLKSVIEKHAGETDSEKAKKIMSHWEHYEPLFWKADPK